MAAKPLRTKPKSASAERCLRALGATRDMATPDMETSNCACEGCIVAWRFTKRQPGGRGDYWGLSLSGNCWHQRTVGERGPATLENYHFLEKISHFDRERIPERVVHARGFVCYGEFEATGKIGDEPASKYTRAKLFQEAGKKTELAIRFSTVIGGRDSSEAARDPRGF